MYSDVPITQKFLADAETLSQNLHSTFNILNFKFNLSRLKFNHWKELVSILGMGNCFRSKEN